MVKPGGTGMPRRLISAKPAPLPPSRSFWLPSPSAEAYTLESHFGNTIRAVKQRYPNVRMVFVESRSYSGYSLTSLNPEPYAYEYGWTMKWLMCFGY